MNTRFDNLETSLAGVKTALAANSSRITSLDGTREVHDAHITKRERSCNELYTQNKLLKVKLRNLRGRSRRQNIRVVALPEKIKRGSLTAFTSELLPKLLGANHFLHGIKVDRARRIAALGNKLHAMIDTP